jgi:three-Cys-motif partner protein
MAKHEFGGAWTQDKLERIRSYLVEYTKIFTKNAAASFYTTIYVDALAGTGYRTDSQRDIRQENLFPELNETDAQEFLKGSTRIALEVEPPFDQFVFVEKIEGRVDDLNILKAQFPEKADRIKILQGDCNQRLKKWCDETNWQKHRAVVFLDPYGMQVSWELIETIAKTRAIDLWILFPLGMAVNRMLTRGERPPKKWAENLTRIFGSDEWQKEFYRTEIVDTLFGDQYTVEAKDADFKKISKYFVCRLKNVFPHVSENPHPLRNSRNVPLFLLCFAAGNPNKGHIAVKIASHILSM